MNPEAEEMLYSIREESSRRTKRCAYCGGICTRHKQQTHVNVALDIYLYFCSKMCKFAWQARQKKRRVGKK